MTVVVGPSGAGKSSLLRLCNRLEVADRGSVRFQGEDVAAHGPARAAPPRRHGVPDARRRSPGTVLENLRVARPDLGPGDGGRRRSNGSSSTPRSSRRPATELSGRRGAADVPGADARDRARGPAHGRADVLGRPQATLALEQLARRLLGARGRRASGSPTTSRRCAASPISVLVVLDGSIAHAGPLADLDRDAPPTVARFLLGGTTRARRAALTETRETMADIGWSGLAISLVLVGVAIGLSMWRGLGLERSIAWATVRALVQLIAVGLALQVLLRPDTSHRVVGALGRSAMIAVRGRDRPPRAPRGARRSSRSRSPRSVPRRSSCSGSCSASASSSSTPAR